MSLNFVGTNATRHFFSHFSDCVRALERGEISGPLGPFDKSVLITQRVGMHISNLDWRQTEIWNTPEKQVMSVSESVFIRVVYRIGIFRSVSVGISWYLPYRYGRKSRPVHFGMFFLAGNPTSLKKGAMAPFLRKKDAPAPFLIQPAPLLRKNGVPAK